MGELIKLGEYSKSNNLPSTISARKTKTLPRIITIPPYYYDTVEGCLYLRRKHKGEISDIRLCNFFSIITHEILKNSGLSDERYYVIETMIKNTVLPTITVHADKFKSLCWLSQIGVDAIIEPGSGKHDHIRHAIQIASHGYTIKINKHTETGWIDINGVPVYLTSSGGITANQVENDITVELPMDLNRYNIPLSPINEKEAIETSFSFLDIGNRSVTLPLLAFLYLAPLTSLLEPKPNFSGYLFGRSGSFKTTIAMLLLSHFGDFNGVDGLCNFEDTANKIEDVGFILKDVLMILDDYHPSINSGKADAMEIIAQRIIRSFSNRTGRGRLTDKERRGPRGLILVTAEEQLNIQSAIARLMLVNVTKTDINIDALTLLQGKTHLLPNAMSSYIIWVSKNIEEIKQAFKDEFVQQRQISAELGTHMKLAEQVAFLLFSLKIFLLWLLEKQVIEKNTAINIQADGSRIFKEMAKQQHNRIEDEDPVKLFMDILEDIITQGKVSLNHRTNKDEFIGNGEQLGWYDTDYYYFMPETLWCIIKHRGHFPVKKHTLYTMLDKHGIIVTGRDKNTVVKRIYGEIKRVLTVKRTSLFG
ncbi:MAG: hypothetical protein HQL06_08740 [Nitrospirae bacterium]|nr:hypothetical protein [Nitrospirota bacterium]